MRRILSILTLAVVAVAGATGTADAAKHKHHHHHPVRHPAPYRLARRTILGHQTTTVSWKPGGKVSARLAYSKHSRNPLTFGTLNHAFATMNGDTWDWGGYMPTGTARSRGVWIHRFSARPAVGFYSTGGIVFGAKQATKHGTADIVSGLGYLLRKGKIQHTFPWAHPVQISCGPRGTDGGPGCWRSNIVRYKGGRVGMVEVSFASMATTARILKSMGVVDALTLDSGGSSVLGWRKHTTGQWHQAGIQHALGNDWLRPTPEAIVLVRR